MSAAPGSFQASAHSSATGERHRATQMAFDTLGGEHGFTQGSRFATATTRRAPYRAVFISDLHLGTPGCQAEALLEFLKEHPSEYLYLVGDIVDGWQLRRKWYWPQSHNDVVQKIMRKARKGCRVVFIPGNHDMFARQFEGQHFGGIAVQQEAVHVTATGQRLWVTHGDAFDAVVPCARWLAVVSDNLYGITLRLNRHLNLLRGRFGRPYWSLSAPPGHKVRKAPDNVTDFESAVASEARKRGHNGVVCGHSHRAGMRHIDGTLYCNDGDWVENRTALLEHPDGRLELRHWQAAPTSPSDAVPASATACVSRDGSTEARTR